MYLGVGEFSVGSCQIVQLIGEFVDLPPAKLAKKLTGKLDLRARTRRQLLVHCLTPRRDADPNVLDHASVQNDPLNLPLAGVTSARTEVRDRLVAQVA